MGDAFTETILSCKFLGIENIAGALVLSVGMPGCIRYIHLSNLWDRVQLNPHDFINKDISVIERTVSCGCISSTAYIAYLEFIGLRGTELVADIELVERPDMESSARWYKKIGIDNYADLEDEDWKSV